MDSYTKNDEFLEITDQSKDRLRYIQTSGSFGLALILKKELFIR